MTIIWSIAALAIAVTIYVALKLAHIQFRNLALGIGGTITGLLLGALLSVPLGKLPSPYGSLLPITITILLTLVMIPTFINQGRQLLDMINVPHWFGPRPDKPPASAATAASGHEILVDTSVIIDGRIADIAKTGFVPGHLLVPRFVLAELQNIADSEDAMRRGRGRRGLEMLKSIQGTKGTEMTIIDDDVPEIKEVDAKLVAVGKKRGADIMTTDYNLNRVAQIEGVRVLNINELSNAIRPVVLPGEEMMVKIVQAGKERGQGVGYLPDGTMIVVENGDKLIGKEVATEVTRVFQTVAGKMIFAAPRNNVPDNVATKPRASRGNQTRKPATARNSRKPNSQSAIEERLVEQNNPE